ncbi:MAG: DEAD/DEAH box helicase [Nanoarchaeota archaeon]
MKTFAELGMKKEILLALAALKIKEPLEVQEKIIPLALKGRNVVFTSQTGSGKTLAYSLGFLGKLDRKRGLQMLVIVPTRELCIQVGKELTRLGEILQINVGVLYGGRDIKGDFRTITKKNQILIGTPGRLIQHINDKKIRAGEVKCLIFDESDQMFDQGFYDDCVYIKKRVSSDAQILLSSATISGKVEHFMREEIKDYELHKIGIQIPAKIIQEKIFCAIAEKEEALLKILSKKRFDKAIIFCNTKMRSYSLAGFLTKNGFRAISLNSDFDQKERNNHLNLFRDLHKIILVATDVAARGLHIEKVDMVVNYDVPRREEFYIHRIGRTGRNDKDGYALTMVCPEDEERFKKIEFDYKLDCGTMSITAQ